MLNRQVVRNIFPPPMDHIAIQAHFAASAASNSPKTTNIKECSNTNGFELNTEEQLSNEEVTSTSIIPINDRQKACKEHTIISPSSQFLQKLSFCI